MSDLIITELEDALLGMGLDLIGNVEWLGALILLTFVIFGAFLGMDLGLIIVITLPLLIFFTAINLFPAWLAALIILIAGLILAKSWNEGTM